MFRKRITRQDINDAAVRTEAFVDKHPLAAVAIACGSVHIAGYALLAHVTRPPKTTPPTNN